MLLNYCYWSPRGLRASHNKLFVHCVPRPFRRFPIMRGAAGSRSFCTVLFSRIERAPFGRNGWVIYQNGPSGARGFRQKNSSFFGTHEMPEKRPFRTHEVSLWKPKAREFRPRTGQIRTGGRPKPPGGATSPPPADILDQHFCGKACGAGSGGGFACFRTPGVSHAKRYAEGAWRMKGGTPKQAIHAAICLITMQHTNFRFPRKTVL